MPPCYVQRDRAMLGLVDTRSSLTHPFPFPRGRGRGMEFSPTTVCIDLADYVSPTNRSNCKEASKSRNLFIPPRYVHRDRAMLGLVDTRSSLTHPFPFPRGRGRGMEFSPTTVCVDLADYVWPTCRSNCKEASKSQNLFVSPCYAHRDRAMLSFVVPGPDSSCNIKRNPCRRTSPDSSWTA
jgi:hypothetical protein